MIKVFSILITLPYLYVTTTNNIQILQQNFYNENNRYLRWGVKNFLKVLNKLESLFLIINFINMFINNKLISLLNIFYILFFIFKYNKNKKVQNKIPLKYTSRVKRLLFTITLIYTLIILLLYSITKNYYLAYFIYVTCLAFNFYIVFLGNYINKPLEHIVFLYYKFKAKKKLNLMKDSLDIIGITGSYGKTSSKNILNDILSIKYNVLTTPKNYNTQYGLILTINNYMDKFNEIFIAEMGAFKRNRIKLLCDLVKPKYGIITNIGNAHLETFRSKENIQKGKFELIESLPEDGVGILNIDDPYQVKYKLKNSCKIIWIGIDNKNADISASNIKVDTNGMFFDVYFKDLKKTYTFNTKLLGRPNIYNILAGLAFGKYMGMSIEELQLGVKRIKPIEHRLEFKKMKNKIIIDDAYNSNPVGAKMALEVLNLMDGYKIVVTPGMIELGDKQYEFNQKFGAEISKVADFVILVGKEQTKPIYDGLIEKKYSSDQIRVINDVKEAFKIINELKHDKEFTYILLENDLPDIFNEEE